MKLFHGNRLVCRDCLAVYWSTKEKRSTRWFYQCDTCGKWFPEQNMRDDDQEFLVQVVER